MKQISTETDHHHVVGGHSRSKRGRLGENNAQGAATSILLAASPLVEGVTGCYFEDCQEAEPFVLGLRRGVAGYALDPQKTQRLWQVSVDLIQETRQ